VRYLETIEPAGFGAEDEMRAGSAGVGWKKTQYGRPGILGRAAPPAETFVRGGGGNSSQAYPGDVENPRILIPRIAQ